MAEEESGQEKTEEATAKRLEKAREEGQVARSRELGTTLLLMTGSFALMIFGSALNQQFQSIMRFNFGFSRDAAFDSDMMAIYLTESLFSLSGLIILILAMLMLAGVIGSIALSGWLFSPKALAPKLSRLNPLEGLKRMFSIKSLIELLKAVAKFVLVATVAVLILLSMQVDLLAIGFETIEQAIEHSTWVVVWSAVGMSAATIIIAAIDVPFQVYENAKKLKMTKQQVKDEFKDTEGKPEVKGRIRQLQREMAQSRMMAAIPEADVVITNPEHFSVALKYDMQGNGAPTVVAKGADQIAMKIREIANAYQVPLIPTPALTRAIYFYNRD